MTSHRNPESDPTADEFAERVIRSMLGGRSDGSTPC